MRKKSSRYVKAFLIANRLGEFLRDASQVPYRFGSRTTAIPFATKAEAEHAIRVLYPYTGQDVRKVAGIRVVLG